MTTDHLDLFLTATDPIGSDDDLTEDIPSRPRLLLPFWVHVDARARVERGEFQSIRELFQVAIAAFLVQLADADEFQRGLTHAQKVLRDLGISIPFPNRRNPAQSHQMQAEEDAPPFPVDSDRTDGEESAARAAVEEWVDELIDADDASHDDASAVAVSHAKPDPGRRQ
jgi:hypothetical protein